MTTAIFTTRTCEENLGENAWYREVGTKGWNAVDTMGVAHMKPGKKYQVLKCPEGTWPGPDLTTWQRLNLFLHRIADSF